MDSLEFADPITRLARAGADLSFLDEFALPIPFETLLENSRKIIQTPYGEQDGNGVDISLIRANLRLSPTERLRRADRQARALLKLRQHARRIR